MKKVRATMLLSLAVLALSACGGDDENTSENQEQANENVNSQEVVNMSNDDMLEKMDELDYSVVDFDVLYSDSEFEGEIQEEDGLVEAEFYDPISSNTDERGAAAFDAMFPIVSDMEITQDMADENAVSTAIESFDLPDNFLKAELQVTFQDGTEQTFEVIKNEM